MHKISNLKVGQWKLANRHSMININLIPKRKSTWKQVNVVLVHFVGLGMQLASGLCDTLSLSYPLTTLHTTQDQV